MSTVLDIRTPPVGSWNFPIIAELICDTEKSVRLVFAGLEFYRTLNLDTLDDVLRQKYHFSENKWCQARFAFFGR